MHKVHRSRSLFLVPAWICAAAAHAAAGTRAALAQAPAGEPPAISTSPPDPTPASAPAPAAALPAPAPALTLSTAEATALRQQPLVRQQQGQTAAAAGRVEQARAGSLPQVTVSGSYQRTTANLVSRPSFAGSNIPLGPISARTLNYFQFNLAGSQLIYDFGQTDGRWRSAEANQEAAVANEHTVEVQTLLNVRRAYFQARAQKELVDVAAATVKNQEHHLTQIEAFVRAGIRPDIDLAQARTDLANAKVQLVTGANNFAGSLAQLDQAMGVTTDAEPRYDLADNGMPPVDGEDGPLGPLVDRALTTRPELASIQRQRRAQELLIRSLKGGYGPALSAAAGATEVGTEINNVRPNWFGGLTLSWPLLQGGLTRGQVHEATGTLDALAAQEDVLRLQVRVDVEQARLGVRAAKATITAAGEALVNGRDQLRLAEARYAHGLGSAIELGDAQIAFSNAAAQDVQARYGLSTARAQLLAAVGVR